MANTYFDYEFLKELSLDRDRRTFVKILILDMKEEFVMSEVQGRVTGGSINVDGASAVRRTCSLNFLLDDNTYDITNVTNLLSINKKIKVMIGLENHLRDDYDDIIWFPQGIFLISQPNISHTSQGISVSLSCADKMCLLNGNLGGTFPAVITFDKYYQQNQDGTTTEVKQKIWDIIYTLVNWYGLEDQSRIFISDLTQYLKQTIYYCGTEPLYYSSSNNVFSYEPFEYTTDVGTYSSTAIYTQGSYAFYGSVMYKSNTAINGSVESPHEWNQSEWNNINYNTSTNYSVGNYAYYEDVLYECTASTSGEWDSDKWVEAPTIPYDSIITYSTGEEIGYTYTDWVFPGDLIANIGDNVCSILDKICSELGNYEYFYDIEGNFIFQEKKNYLNNSYNEERQSLLPYLLRSTALASVTEPFAILDLTNFKAQYIGNNNVVYRFDEDDELIASYSNSPSFLNIKNDYHFWGKSNKSEDYDLHYHLSLRSKPPLRTDPLKVIFLKDESTGEYLNTFKLFHTYHNYELGYTERSQNFPNATCFYSMLNESEITGSFGDYAEGKKVYKQYIASEGWQVFSNTLILDEGDIEITARYEGNKLFSLGADEISYDSNKKLVKMVKYGWEYEDKKLYLNPAVYNSDDVEDDWLPADWREEIYARAVEKYDQNSSRPDYFEEEIYDMLPTIYDLREHQFFEEYIKNPSELKYFVDYLDTHEVTGFGTENIGVKMYSYASDTIARLFNKKDVVNIVVLPESSSGSEAYKAATSEGNTVILVGSDIWENVAEGVIYTAMDRARRDLQEHTSYNETVSLSIIPLYYLEPNTLIEINDEKASLFGNYSISSISIPLDGQSMMSIQAIRALDYNS